MLPDPDTPLVSILQAPFFPYLCVGCTGGRGEAYPLPRLGLLLSLRPRLGLRV